MRKSGEYISAIPHIAPIVLDKIQVVKK